MEEDAKFRWHGARGVSEINYCDFSDLSSIIVTNWTVFDDLLGNMEWAKAILSTLEKSRNTTMHGGVLAKEDIEKRTPTNNSVMPEGLLDTLKDEEIRDLIAYLQKK